MVGAPNSSNSQRLKEVAERSGCAACGAGAARRRYRLGRVRAISRRSASPPVPRRRKCWSRKCSAPSPNATQLEVETMSATEENMFFPLPRPLRQTEAAE